MGSCSPFKAIAIQKDGKDGLKDAGESPVHKREPGVAHHDATNSLCRERGLADSTREMRICVMIRNLAGNRTVVLAVLISLPRYVEQYPSLPRRKSVQIRFSDSESD